MCGIVAYAGGRSALDVILSGLRRLEHLGYDSAGVAVAVDGGLAAAKKAGTLDDVHAELAERPLPAGTIGLGHLRRATHGPPADANAHPQLDDTGHVAVVQNGALADCEELRGELADHGRELTSTTDTEAAAHLLAEHFSSCGDLAEAMRQVCGRLRGDFALAAVHADEPEAVVGACRGLPLVVGFGEGEMFLASHEAAFAPHVREAAAVEPDQVVVVHRDGVRVTDLDGVPVDVRTYPVSDAAGAGGSGEALADAAPRTAGGGQR